MKMIASLLVSEVMPACWLEQSEFLVKGTVSAFTPCLHAKYFFRVSSQSANSLDSLYNCTDIPQVQRRSRGGHRQAGTQDRGGCGPLASRNLLCKPVAKTPSDAFLWETGKKGKTYLFPLLTMKLEAYRSSYYSQLFKHPGSNSA